MRLMSLPRHALASASFDRANCGGKPVAAAKLGADEVAILTESLAKRRNLHLQIILSDDNAGPDAAEEIAFDHQRAVGFEQRQK